MTDQFRVTLVACVAGNPHKAWKVRLPAGETTDNPLAPDREPPDDVWEEQTHDFGSDLDAAKTFVAGLPAETTTHVVIDHSDDDGATWTPIHIHDGSADHLPDAAPGVTPPHLVDSELPFDDDDEISEAPPLMPSQGGQS